MDDPRGNVAYENWKAFLAGAPNTDDGYFLVPKVIE